MRGEPGEPSGGLFEQAAACWREKEG